MLFRRAFVTAALAWAAVIVPAAQQATPPAQQGPPPAPLTFRLETNYIEVDAIVNNSRGEFVRDLRPQDFEIVEDKKPQSIDVFSLVDIPIERADAPIYRTTAVPRDVASNDKDFEGRIYVLLLDSNHVPAADSYLVKRAAKEFIQKFIGPNDLASVVHTQTGRSSDSQEFTSSKTALSSAVDKFIGEKVPSKAMNIRESAINIAGVKEGVAPPPHDSEFAERASKARATLEAISRVASYMSGIRGRRKAMVLFSEGLDYNLEDTLGPRMDTGGGSPIASNLATDNTLSEAIQASALLDTMQKMFEAATRSNVAIYSVDPRGIASETDELMKATGMTEPLAGSTAMSTGLAADMGLVTAAVREELRRQIGTLRTFSEVTGGSAIVGTNNFTAGYRRIVDDNSSYYVLGYHPAELKKDGKFHEVTVRVTRPGLTVRAKKGYYAAKETKAAPAPPDPTVELLNSPMPVSGLGMRATTSFIRGTGANVKIGLTVEISGENITVAEKDGKFTNDLQVGYVAVDMSNKIGASGRKTMTLSMTPQTRQAMVDNGLRLVTEFELAPGRYQLRVAGHDTLSGQTGSVFWDLDVPDLGQSSIVMGNPALTSTSAAKTPTSFEAPSFKPLLPGPPTTAREFVLEDTLAAFVEVFDNNADSVHTVELSAVVRSNTGTQVFATHEQHSSREIGAKRGSYGYLVRIPLHDLTAGRYVLTLVAQSGLNRDPVTKEIEFWIK